MKEQIRNNITSVFEHIGSLKRTGAESPIFLNSTDSCHLIKKGRLNLYFTILGDQGVAGRRFYLTTAHAGDILFPCYKNNTSLLAVPESQCEVISIDLTTLSEKKSPLSSIEISALYENWIKLLLDALSFPPPPVKGMILEKGLQQELNEKTVVHSPENIKWFRPEQIAPEAKIFGCIPFSKTDPKYYFPFTGNVWSASDKKLIYNVKTTADLLAENKLGTQLSNFYKFFLEKIDHRVNNKIVDEAESLKHTSELNSNANVHIFRKIKDLVTGEKSNPALYNRYTENNEALINACRIAGASQGITFEGTAVSESGNSLEKSIETISESSNIRYRKVVLTNNWWKNDSGPIVSFLKDSTTPIAIIPNGSGQKYKVINAANGNKYRLTNNTASQIAETGYIFYRPLPNKKLKPIDLIRYCSKGMFTPILLILLVGCLGSLLGLLTPIFTEKIINHAIPKCDVYQLKQIAVILTATAIAGTLFSMTRSLIMLRFTSKIDSSLESALLDRLFSLPIPFYSNYLAGDLAQRCNAVRNIRHIFSSSIISTILGALFSIFYLGLCFYYSSAMAALGFAAAFLFAAFYLLSGVIVTKVYMQPMLKINGKMQGRILQFVSAITQLRITSSENRAIANWVNDYTEYAKLQRKSSLIQSFLNIISYLYPTLTTILFFYLIGANIVKNVNIGEFMAFTAAYSSFQTAILHLTTPFLQFVKLSPIFKRAKPILDEVPEVNTTSMKCPKITGDIELINLKFRYTQELPHVLNNVSIKINSGEYAAIVGPSGSGKSTLMRVMLGFDSPESGSVYYNQNDLAQINKKELRKQTGVVLQNSKLINASIYENIVGGSDLPIEAAWEAAKMAGVAEEINEMPMGMHTVVGVGTGGLSGGQEQRILIARALVRKPKILFFDEATSALDNKTQAQITKSLKNLSVTRIAIAHRLSTIINADIIYVLDKGQIAQKGNFNDLMKDKGGLFHKLASRQMM